MGTSSLGQACQYLVILTTRKDVSWCSDDTSCVWVCVHFLMSFHWAPLKSPALSSLNTPFRCLYTWVRSVWAFFSEVCTVPALSTFLHRGDAPVPVSSLWPFVALYGMSMSLLHSRGQNGHNSPGLSSPVLEGQDNPSWPAGNAVPNAAQVNLGFFATRVHCWRVFSSVLTRTPRSFSVKLLFTWDMYVLFTRTSA